MCRVQKAPGTTTTADGIVQLHWLAEGKDGLYRRTAGIYQVCLLSPAHQGLQLGLGLLAIILYSG